MAIKIKPFFFLFALFFTNAMGFAQQKIKGCFESNFPVIGYYETRLQLKEDSSFIYQFLIPFKEDPAEALVVDSVGGFFKIQRDTLYLFYQDTPLTDTSRISYWLRLILYDPSDYRNFFRPEKLLYKHHQLIRLATNGVQIPTAHRHFPSKDPNNPTGAVMVRKKYFLKYKGVKWKVKKTN